VVDGCRCCQRKPWCGLAFRDRLSILSLMPGRNALHRAGDHPAGCRRLATRVADLGLHRPVPHYSHSDYAAGVPRRRTFCASGRNPGSGWADVAARSRPGRRCSSGRADCRGDLLQPLAPSNSALAPRPLGIGPERARRTGGGRACAGALQQRSAGNKDGLSQDAGHGNKGCCSSAIRRAPAHDGRETRWRQAQLAKPRRSSPCPGNRQDAAGNHRGLQGRSPEPCRRRHCPPQAGWPHRRARQEVVRNTVDGDGATRRGVNAGKKRASADPDRSGRRRSRLLESSPQSEPHRVVALLLRSHFTTIILSAGYRKFEFTSRRWRESLLAFGGSAHGRNGSTKPVGWVRPPASKSAASDRRPRRSARCGNSG
jgi:hypothetical protein